jgi:hypothetical protein
MGEGGHVLTNVSRHAAAAVALGAAGLVALAAASAPRSVVDLQPFSRTQSVAIRSSTGRSGQATLVDLNPTIGAWYLLTVAWSDGGGPRIYHLENSAPRTQRVGLDPQYPAGLIITERTTRHECDLFGGGDTLGRAAAGAPFEPLCNSRLFLRNRASGRHTRLEAATDFVRERVWGGESLIGVGHQLLGDRHLETGAVATSGGRMVPPLRDAPLPALVDAAAAAQTVTSNNLGISVAKGSGGLVPGAWYAASGSPGVFVSLLQSGMVAASIRQDRDRAVNALDSVEASALCYLIAFDLDGFEIAYAGGTQHPEVGWSAHMQARLRDPQQPGPDGIGTTAPLIATGLVSPADVARTVAVFTGGFKRAHGAFLYGDLAARNRGSHYGFVENGVVLSTLQPGLATIVVMADGRLTMKTWAEGDAALLGGIRHARQNGVAIVEYDEARQATVPGRLVNQWGPGNWSGSADLKLRTIRAAAALQRANGKDFLLYAVFSAATPSAMARVFQAYQCRYAMLLDMNALEHTYLALHKQPGSRAEIEHLVKGMAQLDRSPSGAVVPRFVAVPDNRDFFYVMRRSGPERP